MLSSGGGLGDFFCFCRREEGRIELSVAASRPSPPLSLSLSPTNHPHYLRQQQNIKTCSAAKKACCRAHTPFPCFTATPAHNKSPADAAGHVFGPARSCLPFWRVKGRPFFLASSFRLQQRLQQSSKSSGKNARVRATSIYKKTPGGHPSVLFVLPPCPPHLPPTLNSGRGGTHRRVQRLAAPPLVFFSLFVAHTHTRPQCGAACSFAAVPQKSIVLLRAAFSSASSSPKAPVVIFKKTKKHPTLREGRPPSVSLFFWLPLLPRTTPATREEG